MTSKTLVALFGGICSGKSTLARAVSGHLGYCLVSKDQAIYEADKLTREKGIPISFEAVREKKIAEFLGENIILDETVRPGALAVFAANGYTLVGVQILATDKDRRARLEERKMRQDQIVIEIERALGFDLSGLSREGRQELWRNREFWNQFNATSKASAEAPLQEIYRTGSHFMKPEYPNVFNFPELDYVCEYESLTWPDRNQVFDLLSNKVAWREYTAMRKRKIKHAIFDVGGVIYDYTKDGLFHAIKMHGGAKTHDISFDEYMSGAIGFDQFCEDISRRTGAKLGSEFCEQVCQGLQMGRSKPRKNVIAAMGRLVDNGVGVSVLSNAIPALEAGEPYYDIVPKNRRFFSFNTGYLKPDYQAYRNVLESLEVSPLDTLFIDDKPMNVQASREIGMQAFVFSESSFDEEISHYL